MVLLRYRDFINQSFKVSIGNWYDATNFRNEVAKLDVMVFALLITH
jgi:hypothetical protein